MLRTEKLKSAKRIDCNQRFVEGNSFQTHPGIQHLTFNVKPHESYCAHFYKRFARNGGSYFLINPETSLVLVVSDSWHHAVKLRSQRRERFNSVSRNNGPRDQLFTMPTPRGVITRDRSHHAREYDNLNYILWQARCACIRKSHNGTGLHKISLAVHFAYFW